MSTVREKGYPVSYGYMGFVTRNEVVLFASEGDYKDYMRTCSTDEDNDLSMGLSDNE